MTSSVGRLIVALCFLSVTAAHASGQGGATSSISGVVTDTAGGVIPGATVVITSNATNTKSETVTNSSGTFSVPALSAGTYTVTVSLAGFKTASVTDVPLQLGVPTTVNAVLEIGSLAETITVTGASAALINTQTPAVVATLNVDEVAAIPTPTRNALNAVTYMVGVNTTGGMRGIDRQRAARVVSQHHARRREQQRHVQQDDRRVLLAGEAPSGCRGSGERDLRGRRGGCRRRRGGVDQLHDAAGHQPFHGQRLRVLPRPVAQHEHWFNRNRGLEKDQVRLNQFGARQGGPIVIPGLFDGHGKAFFFVHYEETRLPNTVGCTRPCSIPERSMAGSATPWLAACARSTCWISRAPADSWRRRIRPSCTCSGAFRTSRRSPA